jgi:hypothetical protein
MAEVRDQTVEHVDRLIYHDANQGKGAALARWLPVYERRYRTTSLYAFSQPPLAAFLWLS